MVVMELKGTNGNHELLRTFLEQLKLSIATHPKISEHNHTKNLVEAFL